MAWWLILKMRAQRGFVLALYTHTHTHIYSCVYHEQQSIPSEQSEQGTMRRKEIMVAH